MRKSTFAVICVFLVFNLALLVSARTYSKGLVLPLVSRQTRTLTRLASGPIVPLNGNLTYWGEYFTKFGLGTPPQTVYLQVDTGSTDLIVYTPSCSGCPSAPYHSYNIGSSSSANQIWCDSSSYDCSNMNCDGFGDNCKWEDDYAGGSDITGYVYTDVVTIGGITTQSTIAFGGIQTVSFPSGQQFQPNGVSGIAGLAFQQLSGFGASSWFDAFVGDYNWYNGFSICLNTQNNGQNNGQLQLGVDYTSDSRFLWTPLTQEVWWSIAINDMLFGGKSLGLSSDQLNSQGVIVDSGTTLLIVPNLIMNTIKTQLTSMCPKTNLIGICNTTKGQTMFDGYCFSMTTAQVNVYPSLSINFPGSGHVKSFSLTWSPMDYLWQGSGTPGFYCMGIQALAPGSNSGIIIGDILMQKYHVAFDKNVNKVGFGPKTSCPS